MARCTAVSKSTGAQCKQPAVEGTTKCHYHGGRSLKGMASPSWKTGRYSKYMPARLLANYEAARTDPDLVALRDELALLDARLMDLLKRVDTGESGDAWSRLSTLRAQIIAASEANRPEEVTSRVRDVLEVIRVGAQDIEAWAEIRQTIEQRRKVAESEVRRLAQLQQMITSERAMDMIGRIAGIIKTHVTDKRTLSRITADLAGLVGGNAGQLVGAGSADADDAD